AGGGHGDGCLRATAPSVSGDARAGALCPIATRVPRSGAGRQPVFPRSAPRPPRSAPPPAAPPLPVSKRLYGPCPRNRSPTGGPGARPEADGEGTRAGALTGSSPAVASRPFPGPAPRPPALDSTPSGSRQRRPRLVAFARPTAPRPGTRRAPPGAGKSNDPGLNGAGPRLRRVGGGGTGGRNPISVLVLRGSGSGAEPAAAIPRPPGPPAAGLRGEGPIGDPAAGRPGVRSRGAPLLRWSRTHRPAPSCGPVPVDESETNEVGGAAGGGEPRGRGGRRLCGAAPCGVRPRGGRPARCRAR